MRVFEKKHGPSILYDWERVGMLYEASDRSMHFSAPKPIKYDLAKEAISYEILPDGESLRDITIQSVVERNNASKRLPSLFKRIGAALADFHKLSRPTCGFSIDFSLNQFGELIRFVGNNHRYADESLNSYHGDYCPSNVWITQAEEIFFIDPIPSRYFPQRGAGLVPIYFDVAQMIADLHFHYPLKIYPLINWENTVSWIASFYSGYQSVGPRFNADLLLRYILYLSRLIIDDRVKQDRWLTGKIRKNVYWFRSRIPVYLPAE